VELKAVLRRPEVFPKPGGVDVWHFECEPALLASSETLAWTLSEEERVTASRFRDNVQRKRNIAHHATARSILALYAPGLPTPIVLGKGLHGKPYVAAPEEAKHLRFNIAHSGALCLVAVASAGEVGIDVERVRHDIAMDDIAQMYFTSRELEALCSVPDENRAEAFFACWTRKEALLKAQGTGFIRPPQRVHVGLGAHDPASAFNGSGWTVQNVDLPAGYAGAVAVEGTQIRVRVREWRLSSQGE
jgi:4'-phosphopantetheinyl transferase